METKHIVIDEKLHRELKEISKEKGVKLYELANISIKEGLSKVKNSKVKKERPEIRLEE